MPTCCLALKLSYMTEEEPPELSLEKYASHQFIQTKPKLVSRSLRCNALIDVMDFANRVSRTFLSSAVFLCPIAAPCSTLCLILPTNNFSCRLVRVSETFLALAA
jgi:hypothetical protein